MNNGSDAAAYTPETDERARRAATEVPRAGMAARTRASSGACRRDEDEFRRVPEATAARVEAAGASAEKNMGRRWL